MLQVARRQGYALDDGEYTYGVYCVAVPIKNSSGATIAGMSCSVPKARIEQGELPVGQLIEVLVRQSRLISAALEAPVPR